MNTHIVWIGVLGVLGLGGTCWFIYIKLAPKNSSSIGKTFVSDSIPNHFSLRKKSTKWYIANVAYLKYCLYFSVPNWKKCTETYSPDDSQHNEHCLPTKKPEGCPASSWNSLKSVWTAIGCPNSNYQVWSLAQLFFCLFNFFSSHAICCYPMSIRRTFKVHCMSVIFSE